MNIVDIGHGLPLVIVPGIQGRWEWHRPAIHEMAKRCRVLTFSYDDIDRSPATGLSSSCIDAYCQQIHEVLERTGVERAAICGISYGGLVAATFAARHPERVSALILASALPPTWKPDARIRAYLTSPRLMLPLFLVGSLRMWPEIARASRHAGAAVMTAGRHAWNALTHMFSPTLMARRAAGLAHENLSAQVTSIAAPALIIVGDADADRIVPVALTLEYKRFLPAARVVTLERTGHLGCVTKPREFAELVERFASDCDAAADTRRRLG
jgi:pimeloyl-ACP methyl ester carboxylesterase